jgi:hypothetical protein
LDARDNIWKAYAYTETSRGSHGILVLKAGNTKVTEERQEADLLLASFFPVPPELADRDDTSVKPRLVTRNGSRPYDDAGKKVPLRIKLPKLTLGEVQAAIMQSKSDTFRVLKRIVAGAGQGNRETVPGLP